MALNVYAWGAYAAYDPKETPYRPDDYTVNCLVRAVKGKLTGKQYALVDAVGLTGKIRVNSEYPGRAFEVFGRWGNAVLSKFTNAALVPVPASDHTTCGAPFTGSKLALAIAGHASARHLVAAPILAFKNVMPKASAGESGARDRTAIKNALKLCVDDVPAHVVLIDDVCTSGAHFLACAEFLREKGAHVDTALCLGRTVWEQLATPLAVPPEDIEVQHSFLDF